MNAPLSNHPSRPDKPWRSHAAMNEPRDGDYAGYDEESLRRDIARFGRRYGLEIVRQICAEELNLIAEGKARG